VGQMPNQSMVLKYALFLGTYRIILKYNNQRRSKPLINVSSKIGPLNVLNVYTNVLRPPTADLLNFVFDK
jgi:hypothetical protein